MDKVILNTDIKGLNPFRKGKVRDIYEIGENLLIIATDRISAFDVILPNGIPGKGKVLTQISLFWFKAMESIIENHLVSAEVDDFPELKPYRDDLRDRMMVVKRAENFPVECVVRGYLSGSGWVEYQEKGTVSGVKLPKGLKESDRLPGPVFTPSTKAEIGVHDENISFEDVKKLVGVDLADQLKNKTLQIYKRAAELAEPKGIILADTKFEFGMYKGKMIIIDEILTPDSSRFWPMDQYKPGGPQPSFDKQFVRDYLISIKWNRKPPAPELPAEIIRKTSEKYIDALKRLAGKIL